LKMFMRKWSTVLLWILLHQEHNSHSMEKRFSFFQFLFSVAYQPLEPFDYCCSVSVTISSKYALFPLYTIFCKYPHYFIIWWLLAQNMSKFFFLCWVCVATPGGRWLDKPRSSSGISLT
jgi:hypothetical protein